jgi:hypothetical protein
MEVYMVAPKAFIRAEGKIAKVSLIEFDSAGNVTGAVLDTDRIISTDVDCDVITPFWHINLIKLLKASTLIDSTNKLLYVDDIIIDRRTKYTYVVKFIDGIFMATTVGPGFNQYKTTELANIHHVCRVIGNINVDDINKI